MTTLKLKAAFGRESDSSYGTIYEDCRSGNQLPEGICVAIQNRQRPFMVCPAANSGDILGVIRSSAPDYIPGNLIWFVSVCVYGPMRGFDIPANVSNGQPVYLAEDDGLQLDRTAVQVGRVVLPDCIFINIQGDS